MITAPESPRQAADLAAFHVAEDVLEGHAIDVHGPHGAPEKDEWPAAVPFRLLDGDGEVYYRGALHDDCWGMSQIAALEWGMAYAGCARVEVRREGRWVHEVA